MSDIPFTQYLRPNGRAVEVSIDRPEEISSLARRIIESGFQFECEELTTGHASFTIAGPDGDEDIELVMNGPGVPAAVDELVKRFAAKIGVTA
jgi:hypothetical protein